MAGKRGSHWGTRQTLPRSQGRSNGGSKRTGEWVPIGVVVSERLELTPLSGKTFITGTAKKGFSVPVRSEKAAVSNEAATTDGGNVCFRCRQVDSNESFGRVG